MRSERLILAAILAAIGVGLSAHADQPIVENYVGRQIPTAMVARNLDRGSGFLHPTLDTAPFPNRFLVEPPIYAQLVVWVKTAIGFVWQQPSSTSSGFVWELAGRVTSATMTILGAWAFFTLVRRREGPAIGLLALASFGIMPVTLRYGRAFQPDATMLGFVLLGLAGWDAYQAEGQPRWAWLGGLALAVGLAIKVTAAWALLPFVLVVTRWPLGYRLGAAAVMLLPALAWYGYVWSVLKPGSAAPGASLASADNVAIWLGTLSPLGWLRSATWEAVGRNLLVRAFTPLGFGLAVVGLGVVRPGWQSDRLWYGWGIGCGLAVLVIGAKWHHGYYWLVFAPLVGVGVARVLGHVGTVHRWRRSGSVALGSFFLVGCLGQSASTWRSPVEWASIRESATRIAAVVPDQTLLIAPEAVLYYADRPGLRLELGAAAARRAAGEWGDTIPLDRANADPLALVDFYARQAPGDPRTRFGASSGMLSDRRTPRFVADVGSAEGDSLRSAWRAALRRRSGYSVLIDEPTLILARIDVWPLVAASGASTSIPQP